MNGELDALLAAGLKAMALPIAAVDQQRLLAFLSLLSEWNGAYNLTAVRDPVDMVPRHILDSLTVLPHLRGDRIVDVGSGAGLPGIPLAIADAGRRYILVESNGKKVRFLTHAVRRLGLAHVEVLHGRAEAASLVCPADTVVARAVTDGETARNPSTRPRMLLTAAAISCASRRALVMSVRKPWRLAVSSIPRMNSEKNSP